MARTSNCCIVRPTLNPRLPINRLQIELMFGYQSAWAYTVLPSEARERVAAKWGLAARVSSHGFCVTTL